MNAQTHAEAVQTAKRLTETLGIPHHAELTECGGWRTAVTYDRPEPEAVSALAREAMTKSCGACEFSKPVLFADRTVVCCWAEMHQDVVPTSLADSLEVSMLAEDGADCPVFEAKRPPR